MDRTWLRRTGAISLAVLATFILFLTNYLESAFPRQPTGFVDPAYRGITILPVP